MAKQKLNLQSYQQDILARLKNVVDSPQNTVISRLGVSIANKNYLVSLADISEVVPLPEVTKIPLTKDWFLGVANVRGNLAAITDLARFLGDAAQQVSSESRVLLAHTRFGLNAGLLIERLIGLRDVNVMQLKHVALKNDAWESKLYQDDNNQDWQEINIEVLLTQKEFLQVAV